MPKGLPQLVRDNIEKCRSSAVGAVDASQPGQDRASARRSTSSSGLARAPVTAADVVFFFARKANRDQAVAENTVWEQPAIASTGASIEEVLDCLNRTKTRATYGAVAEVIGGLARGVGQRLGHRRPAASWVVNATSGLPSGYAPAEMHPDLRTAPLVRTGNELRALHTRVSAPPKVKADGGQHLGPRPAALGG